MYNIYRDEFAVVDLLHENGEFDLNNDILIQTARVDYIRPCPCPLIQKLWAQHEDNLFINNDHARVGFPFRISSLTLDSIYCRDSLSSWINNTSTLQNEA